MEEKINKNGYCWLLEQMVDGIFDEKTKHLHKYFSILWHKKCLAQCALFDGVGLVIYPIHTNIKEKQQCEHVSR